jgi:hypothetical protein
MVGFHRKLYQKKAKKILHSYVYLIYYIRLVLFERRTCFFTSSINKIKITKNKLNSTYLNESSERNSMLGLIQR